MILLDTHIWLWLIHEPGKLSLNALASISEAETVGLSTISLWEVAMLESKGRIDLKMPCREWLNTYTKAPKIKLLPITPDISWEAAHIDMHKDPADRLITATALVHDIPLLTVDKKIIASALIRTIP